MEIPIFLDLEGVVTHNGQFIHTIVAGLVKDKISYGEISERYSKARLGGISFNDFKKDFPKNTMKEAMKSVIFHKGAKEFLTWASKKNNLYLASNNIPKLCDDHVKKLKLKKFFKKIFFSCYLKKKKPNADFFYEVLAKSGEKFPAIFVDDAKRNLQVAKELGFITVWVDNSNTNLMEDKRNLVEFVPDYTIIDLKELIEIVESIKR